MGIPWYVLHRAIALITVVHFLRKINHVKFVVVITFLSEVDHRDIVSFGKIALLVIRFWIKIPIKFVVVVLCVLVVLIRVGSIVILIFRIVGQHLGSLQFMLRVQILKIATAR